MGWDGTGHRTLPKFGFHEVTAEGAAPQGWCWLCNRTEGCRHNSNLSSPSLSKVRKKFLKNICAGDMVIFLPWKQYILSPREADLS